MEFVQTSLYTELGDETEFLLDSDRSTKADNISVMFERCQCLQLSKTFAFQGACKNIDSGEQKLPKMGFRQIRCPYSWYLIWNLDDIGFFRLWNSRKPCIPEIPRTNLHFKFDLLQLVKRDVAEKGDIFGRHVFVFSK